ncbi:MAG TPA: enoyl-CoA hydratase [Caulobacteraceae bacterium]|nr:enoyl-CoA hydratase [Caulobacteraceae bacterium]
MSELVLSELDGPIARLTLNDPGHANVLSFAMIEALDAALAEANANPEARVIVLTGAGRIFSAGHDLEQMRATEDKADHQALFDRCGAMMMNIGNSPKPVIARVAGAAVAAGCQLVASCDLAYAAEGVRFAVSGINLGLFCSTPSVALARMVGRKDALEMLLTGRFVSAAEAAQMGLINRAVPADALDVTVNEAAQAIASKAPEAVALGKAVFRRQIEMGEAAAYGLAAERMAENMSYQAAKTGIDAFLDGSARKAS